MESSSKLLESITCPVCIDKVGVYALIECGHNLCSGCIRGIQNISRQIKCPICRVKVTKKPIIFRPLAEYLESGVASQMETFFNTLFNDNANANTNANTNANITNLFDYDGLYARPNTRIINNNNPGNAGNVNNLGQQINIEQLQLQAECEYNYNDWDISEENVMLHEIAQYTVGRTIYRLTSENFSFIKKNREAKAIVFKDTFKIIERYNPLNNRINHRRVILVLENLNIIDKIHTIERMISVKLPSYILRSEMRERNGYQNTLGVYTGLADIQHSNTGIITKQLQIGAKFVWFKNNIMGIRWHILHAAE